MMLVEHSPATHLQNTNNDQGIAPSVIIPRYLNRKNFIPYNISDFGDGGAFPEIHVVQYPLNMGRPGAKSTAVIAVDVDETGQVRYDAIVKQGANKDKIIQTSLADMKESEGNKDLMAMPNKEEEDEAADRTKKALESLLEGKIQRARPSTVVALSEVEEPTYIRYTPNVNAPGYNPAAKQRVIRMVEAQVDPMEPGKHKHKKVPRGPPSPPVPVLHSPPRKLTVKDQQAWKIPPCISNWKNARGYTIPLDKRLASDGRGLQEASINSNFASLSESLYIAERKASDDLRQRNQLRKKMSMKEKEDKEKELREMAINARIDRTTAGSLLPSSSSSAAPSHYQPNHTTTTTTTTGSQQYEKPSHYMPSSSSSQPSKSSRDTYQRSESGSNSEGEDAGRGRGRDREGGEHSRDRDRDSGSPPVAGESKAERLARQQREKLRVERRKEREREIRLENMKGKSRLQKIDRDEGRDISEKIALNMLKGSGKLTGEAMYDSRLFNQSAGLDVGFGAEDEYNTYSKPLFERSEASTVYRPKRDDSDVYGDVDAQLAKLSDTSRFRADKGKGFQGAEGGERGAPRDAPVQFERSHHPHHNRSDEDDEEAEEPRRDSRHHNRYRRGREDEEDNDDDDDGSDTSGRHKSHNSRRRSSHTTTDKKDRSRSRSKERDPFNIRDLVGDDHDRDNRRAKRSRRD